jgi:hypothetical protein
VPPANRPSIRRAECAVAPARGRGVRIKVTRRCGSCRRAPSPRLLQRRRKCAHSAGRSARCRPDEADV